MSTFCIITKQKLGYSNYPMKINQIDYLKEWRDRALLMGITLEGFEDDGVIIQTIEDKLKEE